MWRVIGVSRAHYYRYKAHRPSKRSLEDKDLKQLLEKAIRVYPIGLTYKRIAIQICSIFFHEKLVKIYPKSLYISQS